MRKGVRAADPVRGIYNMAANTGMTDEISSSSTFPWIMYLETKEFIRLFAMYPAVPRFFVRQAMVLLYVITTSGVAS